LHDSLIREKQIQEAGLEARNLSDHDRHEAEAAPKPMIRGEFKRNAGPEPYYRKNYRRETEPESSVTPFNNHEVEAEPIIGHKDKRDAEAEAAPFFRHGDGGYKRNAGPELEAEPSSHPVNNYEAKAELIIGHKDQHDTKIEARGMRDNYRRESEAVPEPYQHINHRREAEAEPSSHPVNNHEAEAEPIISHKDQHDAKIEARGAVHGNSHREADAAPAIQPRGFSSSTLLEPM
jgi:hypothetical protein